MDQSLTKTKNGLIHLTSYLKNLTNAITKNNTLRNNKNPQYDNPTPNRLGRGSSW